MSGEISTNLNQSSNYLTCNYTASLSISGATPALSNSGILLWQFSNASFSVSEHTFETNNTGVGYTATQSISDASGYLFYEPSKLPAFGSGSTPASYGFELPAPCDVIASITGGDASSYFEYAGEGSVTVNETIGSSGARAESGSGYSYAGNGVFSGENSFAGFNFQNGGGFGATFIGALADGCKISSWSAYALTGENFIGGGGEVVTSYPYPSYLIFNRPPLLGNFCTLFNVTSSLSITGNKCRCFRYLEPTWRRFSTSTASLTYSEFASGPWQPQCVEQEDVVDGEDCNGCSDTTVASYENPPMGCQPYSGTGSGDYGPPSGTGSGFGGGGETSQSGGGASAGNTNPGGPCSASIPNSPDVPYTTQYSIKNGGTVQTGTYFGTLTQDVVSSSETKWADSQSPFSGVTITVTLDDNAGDWTGTGGFSIGGGNSGSQTTDISVSVECDSNGVPCATFTASGNDTGDNAYSIQIVVGSCTDVGGAPTSGGTGTGGGEGNPCDSSAYPTTPFPFSATINAPCDTPCDETISGNFAYAGAGTGIDANSYPHIWNISGTPTYSSSCIEEGRGGNPVQLVQDSSGNAYLLVQFTCNDEDEDFGTAKIPVSIVCDGSGNPCGVISGYSGTTAGGGTFTVSASFGTCGSGSGSGAGNPNLIASASYTANHNGGSCSGVFSAILNAMLFPGFWNGAFLLGCNGAYPTLTVQAAQDGSNWVGSVSIRFPDGVHGSFVVPSWSPTSVNSAGQPTGSFSTGSVTLSDGSAFSATITVGPD